MTAAVQTGVRELLGEEKGGEEASLGPLVLKSPKRYQKVLKGPKKSQLGEKKGEGARENQCLGELTHFLQEKRVADERRELVVDAQAAQVMQLLEKLGGQANLEQLLDGMQLPLPALLGKLSILELMGAVQIRGESYVKV
jgi:hypothetical protein